jgi:hypothetical protein
MSFSDTWLSLRNAFVGGTYVVGQAATIISSAGAGIGVGGSAGSPPQAQR